MYLEIVCSVLLYDQPLISLWKMCHQIRHKTNSAIIQKVGTLSVPLLYKH